MLPWPFPASMAVAAGVAVVLASCRLPLEGTGSVFDPEAGVDADLPDGCAAACLADGAGGDAGDLVHGGGPPELAWYLLNESSGTTAHDSTSHHYDITNLTGVTWGQGAAFDGTGGGGSTDVGPDLRKAPLSITAWLAPYSRVDETANSYAITPYPPNAVSGDATGQSGYGIGLNIWSGASALAAGAIGYDFQNVGGAPFVAGTEYFVAVAIGPTTANVYVDGQPVGQAPPMTPGPSTSTTLALGFHSNDPGYGTKRFYAGRMRDVRVYQRELTAVEVATLRTVGPASGP